MQRSQPSRSADGLGPVLQESRTNHGRAIACAFCGVVFALMGLMLVLIKPAGADAADPLTMASGLIFLGLGGGGLVTAIALVWRYWGLILYLHERGIRKVVRGQESVLRFEDADEMTFHSTRFFVHGTYGGTVEHIRVKTNEPGSEPIHFQRKYQEPRAGLKTGVHEATESERMSGRIADLVARKLAARVKHEGSAAWVKKTRIYPWGLEVTRTWGGRVLIEWNQISQVEINQGFFLLWVDGWRSPALRAWTGLPNFWPGYLIITSRVRAAST